MRRLFAFMPAIIVLAGAHSFTLEEAVNTALSRRGDVIAARNDLSSAEWEHTAARTWFLPQVNFSLAYQKSHDVQEMTIPGLGSIPMGSEWASSYGVSATLPLVLQGPAGASMAGTARNMSETSLTAVEQDAVADVIGSFYGVLMAGMMRDVATEASEIALEGYRLSLQRHEAGTISRFELLQSQVAYENRRPDSIAAEAGFQNALSAFAVSLGFRQDHPVTIEGDLCDPFPVELPRTLEEARAIMERNSPELETAVQIREMGDAGVNLAAAGFAPQLVFQTNYSYQASIDDIAEITGEDYSRNWTTSASIQIPIFNGLNDYSGYRSARYQRLASYAQADDIENYASLGLVASWNALEQARETVESAEFTVGQAEEAAEIARISYEAGLITRLDMDGAFLALTQARSNNASALYSLKTAEADLARSLGILEIDGGTGTAPRTDTNIDIDSENGMEVQEDIHGKTE